MHRLPLAVLGLLAAASLDTGQAAPTPDPLSDYRTQMQWRSAPPVALDAARTITCDVASFELTSGEVSALAPLGDGRPTGLVFTGRGRFRMAVPDQFEAAQLARFSRRPLDAIDQPFTRLVIRTLTDLGVGVGAASVENGLLRQRAERWLRFAAHSVDARLVAGSLVPGDDYLWAEVETEDFGWLAFELEPWAEEEVGLYKLQDRNDFLEKWVSLERAAHRSGAAPPDAVSRLPVDVVHVDIQTDLTRHKGELRLSGDFARDSDPLLFRAVLTLRARADGWRVLPLTLSPLAEVTAVTDGTGRPLAFIRDAIGDRFATVGKEVHDDDLTVLLTEPLAAGAELKVDVSYRMRTYNYVSGRSWYPGQNDDLADVHTARMTFLLPKKMAVRAVGTASEAPSGGEADRRSVWEVSRPTAMLGFSFAKDFREETIEQEGVPAVTAFGSASGFGVKSKVRNVAVDVSNALRFFQWFYDVKLPDERIWVTGIDGWHGQAFEGFIHLPAYSFESDHPGATELFRAHEAAHQIFGHRVGWRSYRDQWLSEAFAEYSAMLFVEATMAGERHFEDILTAYNSEQIGSLDGALGKFGRPWNVLLTGEERRQVGPIAAGWRASTALVPGGYAMQAYDKGAMVLHMIRAVLAAATRSEDRFRAIMQDFVKTYSGKRPSTEDFRRVVEKHTKTDWGFFFDEWVYGTAVPTYTWSHTIVEGAEGRESLSLTIAQAGVPDGFRMPLVVRVQFGKDRHADLLVMVSKRSETFTVALPATPSKVELAPRQAVLARIESK